MKNTKTKSQLLLQGAIDSSPLILAAIPFGLIFGAMAMYVVWATCTVIGIVLGQKIPNIASWGLDVAMIVGFIGIVVPNLKNRADWACAVTAMFSTLITYNWPNQTGLLFSSFLAISVAVLLDSRVQTLAEEKNE